MEQFPFDGLVFHTNSAKGGGLTWEMWGSRKFTLDEFEQAIADASQALQHEPEAYNALANRMYAQAAFQQFDQALRDLATMMRLRPGLAINHAERGSIHLRMGKPDEALPLFEKLVEIPDQPPSTYVNALYTMICGIEQRSVRPARPSCG